MNSLPPDGVRCEQVIPSGEFCNIYAAYRVEGKYNVYYICAYHISDWVNPLREEAGGKWKIEAIDDYLVRRIEKGLLSAGSKSVPSNSNLDSFLKEYYEGKTNDFIKEPVCEISRSTASTGPLSSQNAQRNRP